MQEIIRILGFKYKVFNNNLSFRTFLKAILITLNINIHRTSTSMVVISIRHKLVSNRIKINHNLRFLTIVLIKVLNLSSKYRILLNLRL